MHGCGREVRSGEDEENFNISKQRVRYFKPKTRRFLAPPGPVQNDARMIDNKSSVSSCFEAER
jgi:hypothetical protein